MFKKVTAIDTNPISKQLLQITPFLDLDHGPWVAGGAARKLQQNEALGKSDIDIFFPNQQLFSWTSDYLNKLFSVRPVDDTPFYVSYAIPVLDEEKFSLKSLTIQLIRNKYYETLDSLLNNFDFTVTMFATDGASIVYYDQAIEHLKRKLLVLNKVNEHTEYKHLVKYLQKGFTPAPGVMTTKLALRDGQTWDRRARQDVLS